MTHLPNKYLDMLKAEKSQKAVTGRTAKTDKINSVIFDSADSRPISGFSPPLDAEGVPCGGCPKCNQGEFWRWPKFHKDHNPNGWMCWFCSPASWQWPLRLLRGAGDGNC